MEAKQLEKNMIPRVAIYLLLVLGLIYSGCCLYNRGILTELFIDDEKLTEPVLSVKYDLRKDQREYHETFRVMYAGPYNVWLKFNRTRSEQEEINRERDEEGRVDIERGTIHMSGRVILSADEEIIMNKEFHVNLHRALLGTTISHFFSPKQVPLKKDINLKFEILDVEPEFYEKFVSVELIVGRAGDGILY